MANCPVCACYTRDDLRHCPTCGEALASASLPVGPPQVEPELNLGFGAGLLFGLVLGTAVIGWAYMDQRRTAAAAAPTVTLADAGGGSSCRMLCRRRCEKLWPGRCRDEGPLMRDCAASCKKAGELGTVVDH